MNTTKWHVFLGKARPHGAIHSIEAREQRQQAAVIFCTEKVVLTIRPGTVTSKHPLLPQQLRIETDMETLAEFLARTLLRAVINEFVREVFHLIVKLCRGGVPPFI